MQWKCKKEYAWVGSLKKKLKIVVYFISCKNDQEIKQK